MRLIKAIFLTALVVLIIIFIAQNMDALKQPIRFEFSLGFGKAPGFTFPFGGYVLLAFIAGYLLAFLMTFGERLKIRRDMRKLRKEGLLEQAKTTGTSVSVEKSENQQVSTRKFDG